MIGIFFGKKDYEYMKSRNYHILKFLFLLNILFLGCNVDLETKNWASEHLEYKTDLEVLPHFFGFYYAKNDGVALDTFSTIPRKVRYPLIFALTGLTSIFLWLFIWVHRFGSFRILLPIFLMLSGAFGNLFDRVFNGHVIDFIHFYHQDFHFPIFNVADILVLVGLGLFTYQVIFRKT